MEWIVSSQRGKYSPEFKDAAVREVIDNSRTIADVARSLDVVEQTLGNWVKAYRELHAGEEPELSVSERARIKELERENRELKLENEFLGKSVASSRRNTGEREVRVHRRRRRQLPDLQDVSMGEGVPFRVLRMVGSGAVGDRGASRRTRGASEVRVRALRRHLGVPADPCPVGPLGPSFR